MSKYKYCIMCGCENNLSNVQCNKCGCRKFEGSKPKISSKDIKTRKVWKIDPSTKVHKDKRRKSRQKVKQKLKKKMREWNE